MKYLICVLIFAFPMMGIASEGGTEFKSLYEFINGAATGYLGRSIAIAAGVIGLGLGAMAGKMMIAASGVGIAIFGVYGPKVINQFFQGAII